MPPRNESLPEGTDQIIDGAAETGKTGGGGGGSGGGGGGGRGGKRSGSGSGFVASGGGNDTGTSGSKGGSAAGEGLSADRIIAQVRDQVASLRDQATGRAREVAEGGKDRTTSLLEELAGVFEETARAIDERLGDQYGDYAHRAGDAISSFAGSLREKTVEDLIEDTRSVVRKSPAVTVGTAALLGFLLVRLVKTGLDDVGLTGGSKGGGGRSGGSSGGGA